MIRDCWTIVIPYLNWNIDKKYLSILNDVKFLEQLWKKSANMEVINTVEKSPAFEFGMFNSDAFFHKRKRKEYRSHKRKRKEYRSYGVLHMDNRPAVIVKGDRREWYWNGKLHRKGDKPAIEREDGTKEWYKHGKRHRDDYFPAIETIEELSDNNNKEWWINGKRHYSNISCKKSCRICRKIHELWGKLNNF